MAATSINGYRVNLRRKLGDGAFSQVFLGVHEATGEEVAIKKISRSGGAGYASAAERAKQAKVLDNEVKIMRKIMEEVKHPNLILMRDVFGDDQYLYLVLEVLRGGELFDRIVGRGHYTEEDASQLTRRLIEAIKALHDGGIIHRDMKPENILFASAAEDAPCKITDFGLAQITTEAQSDARRLVGTPGYVAPEVLSSRLYTPACDIWGMGVILYILLVGYPPFYGGENDRRNRQLFAQIQAGAYEFHEDAWGEISKEAKDLVARMLTVDHAKRITSEQILAHPWIVDKMPEVELKSTQARMKKFNARRKFRAAAKAILFGTGFTVRPKLQDVLSGVDTGSLTLEELQKIADSFQKICGADASRGCLVSSEDFQNVMTDLGFGALPLPRVFNIFDVDGNGQVDYRELVVCLSLLKARGEKAIALCFNLYDLDGSGYITRDELAKVLQFTAVGDMALDVETARMLGEVRASIARDEGMRGECACCALSLPRQNTTALTIPLHPRSSRLPPARPRVTPPTPPPPPPPPPPPHTPPTPLPSLLKSCTPSLTLSCMPRHRRSLHRCQKDL